jgi:predicted TIM-barrel fold metal-dependent hydrolase
MNQRVQITVVLAALLLACSANTSAQTADATLMAQIHRIKAIDNHSHPPRVVGAGETDDEFDALPCYPLEPTPVNLTLQPDNPMYLAAWHALWSYAYQDRSPDHVAALVAQKKRIREAKGDSYSAWVLDQLGIETELANRVTLGRGLTPPRFRWVPFDDALLFPLNNEALAAETPDRKIFFAREDALLARYRQQLGIAALPATLAEYTARVVTPELESQKQAGAVAVKFEAAYLRSLDFEPVDQQQAAAVYAEYAHGGSPVRAEYRSLQNYLFRYIAAEAGRLQMAVHIHTGAGCGGYFSLRDSDPLLLESVLNDPNLRKTNFVLLHGGSGPFTKELASLLLKPNVYTDISEQTWMLEPRALATVLRDWLEAFPEKVLFGTDLFPGDGAYDWEEIGWQTAETGRQALGIALTGMMQDGEITRPRAVEIARQVLRGNALKLYGWSDQP